MGKHAWAIIAAFGIVVIVAFFVIANRNTSIAPTRNGNQSMTSQTPLKEISMIAKSWEFVPATIAVRQGEKVRLKIKSVDVDHGFAIPDFKVNETLSPGKETVIEFVADKKGMFTFFCSVVCGQGHRDMKGKLIVE